MKYINKKLFFRDLASFNLHDVVKNQKSTMHFLV